MLQLTSLERRTARGMTVNPPPYVSVLQHNPGSISLLPPRHRWAAAFQSENV